LVGRLWIIFSLTTDLTSDLVASMRGASLETVTFASTPPISRTSLTVASPPTVTVTPEIFAGENPDSSADTE